MIFELLSGTPGYVIIRWFTVWIPVILLGLTVHEFAHGWIAYLKGDTTAKDNGRLTLNPLAHLHPIGTIGLLIGFFGWGKPVPINPYNMRNPRKDVVWVSFAGPASNLIVAFIFGFMVRLLTWGYTRQQLASGFIVANLFPPQTFKWYLFMFASSSVVINIALACFNLLPLFPLDGSKIVEGLLPYKYAYRFAKFHRYGLPILMGIIMLEVFFHLPFSILGTYIQLLGHPIAFLASGAGFMENYLRFRYCLLL